MAAVPAELYKSLRTSIEMRIHVWWVSGLVLPAAIISCNQCPKINMTADCAHHSHSSVADLYFISECHKKLSPQNHAVNQAPLHNNNLSSEVGRQSQPS